MLLVAVALAAPLLVSPADGQIGFRAVATLADFGGRAETFSGTFDPVVGAGLLVIPVASLRTGLGPRDSRMQEFALERLHFPEIRLVVDRVSGTLDGLRSGQGGGTVNLWSQLTIRDVTRPLSVPATFAWEGDALRLTGSLPLRWSDWGVPDASTVLSTIGPEVTIQFDVLGRPE